MKYIMASGILINNQVFNEASEAFIQYYKPSSEHRQCGLTQNINFFILLYISLPY